LCKNLFEKSRVQSKTNIGITFEKGIEDLDSRKHIKYVAIKNSYVIEHKNEKVKLKKENLRRLGLRFGTELSAKNKI